MQSTSPTCADMARLYLIRHGAALSPGSSVCLGSGSNPPLTPIGERECLALAEWFKYRTVSRVYSSPLERCAQTSELVFGTAASLCSGLAELYMGAWDGLDFSEIRSRYPKLYAERGKNPLLCPPGGEPHEAALERMYNSILEIAAAAGDGSAAVVSHGGVLGLLLCRITDRSISEYRQIQPPCGSVSIIDTYGEKLLFRGTLKPSAVPDENQIKEFYELAGTSPDTIEHCRAVMQSAMEICRELEAKGHVLDTPLVRAAALLHDVCRSEKNHEHAGAKLLHREGYNAVGDVIACHSDLPRENERVCEHAVLYLADKLVCGTENVSLDERFASSAGKCTTDEAKRAHRARWEQAKRIHDLLTAKSEGY